MEEYCGTEPLELASGKYLLYVKWITPPEEDGKNAQTIGFLESPEAEGISWMNWNGSPEVCQTDTGPYKGYFMIDPIYV